MITYTWRGAFSNEEVNGIHAEAFAHRVYDETEWDWEQLLQKHSLGWVVARQSDDIVGFVNVPWDGLVHAWIQDMMVPAADRRRGIGVTMIAVARDAARDAGCEWLHVDFDDDLAPFYIDSCGFAPTGAGLIDLSRPQT
jgi:GNAT superfamily N-acetyltransferase